ncbi:baseplate J/gp47 family protein [Salmonella enterica]|nr:baseplate J/gp47 family protein [Salmonella enterica]EHL7670639.1 baseplate J/gp47 family protein [Salmonella enterica]EHM8725097.1 baseplate J/gp47 family protein [Salmonella enterica]EKE5542609.1 baseplate J/gp47 family protein [Salmonella enterica]HBJ6598214.1 baseplate J/gp47 family protein [Salmonella enterica subsp. enterica serovar Havana]
MTDYKYIDSTGVIMPDTDDVIDEVRDEFRAVFGDDIITDDWTPQGVLINAEVKARTTVIENNAAVANQINPNLAGGIFLDAIWMLTGGQRRGATYSQVTGICRGVAGSIIPAGSRARTKNGDEFATLEQVIIGDLGTVNAVFQATSTGPIPAPAGSLTQIIDAVLGWETVTNDAVGSLGQDVQSDVSARAMRRKTLALQGVSITEAITSALYNTPGVRSLKFRENVYDVEKVIDGVTMRPHSIYVCVDGGTDDDIAQALLASKSAGCGYNGNTTVTVTDPISGQKYVVNFDRPEEITVLMRVDVSSRAMSTVQIQNAVRLAIIDYARGEQDGEDGYTVGTDASPFEAASAVNRIYPDIFIKKLEIADSNTMEFSTETMTIEIWQKAVIAESTIQVNIV